MSVGVLEVVVEEEEVEDFLPVNLSQIDIFLGERNIQRVSWLNYLDLGCQ